MFAHFYTPRFGSRFPTLGNVPAVAAEAMRFYFANIGTEVELVREFDGNFNVVVFHSDDKELSRDIAFNNRAKAAAFACVALQSVANKRREGGVCPDTTSLGGRRLQDDMTTSEATEGELRRLFLALYNGDSELRGPFLVTLDRSLDGGIVATPPRYFSTLAGAVEQIVYQKRDWPELEFSVSSFDAPHNVNEFRKVSAEELLLCAEALLECRKLDAEAATAYVAGIKAIGAAE